MIHCVFLQYKQTKFEYPYYLPIRRRNILGKYRLDKGTCKFGSRTSRCYGAEFSGSKQTTCVLFAITPTESKLSKPYFKYKR